MGPTLVREPQWKHVALDTSAKLANNPSTTESGFLGGALEKSSSTLQLAMRWLRYNRFPIFGLPPLKIDPTWLFSCHGQKRCGPTFVNHDEFRHRFGIRWGFLSHLGTILTH